jgi:5-methylcytosine-specific restriction endonuclease McrA
VGASNYPGLGLPKPRAKALDADDQAKADRQHDITVYHDVDVRDKRQCTCCGRRGNPYATTTLGKLHHDHLQGGSGQRITETWNVALLCWICHEYKTANLLEPSGNPDRHTLIWTIRNRKDGTRTVAEKIFTGRKKSAHVRIVEA